MFQERINENRLLNRGLSYLEGCTRELVDLIVKITEIPAPSHDEAQRGAFVEKTMREFGFPTVRVDEAGNVLGFLPGTDPSKVVVSMAHMDTVFPRGTDLSVKRDGNILSAPGVSDNSASVAQMLLIGKILAEQLPLPHPVIMVGNVGEEGLGDLKGARHFCKHVTRYDFDGFQLDPSALVFFNIDGNLGQLTTAGIGSKRLKVVFSGQGGHSFGSFGNSSAIHGLCTAVAGISKVEVPENPITTYNVGVIAGGHSVNSIAESAEMLVDMRSVDSKALERLEEEILTILCTAAKSTQTCYKIFVVGERPPGSMPEDSPYVRGLTDLARSCGIELRCGPGSTDSNIPLSLGWPAVTIGFKSSENAHKTSEFLRIDSLVPGTRFALRCYAGLLYDRF